ncbi:MAG: hypothetical protein ACJ8EW_30335 [Rhizobium sp.]|uniref:hypothetical protein n=1 Tax=Rhizobium sp. TaxID=391 RepID=UPI00389A4D45
MSMFYHIRQKGEYRLVHCSNASDANLVMNLASPLPFLLATIREPAPVAGVLAVGKLTSGIFALLISLSAEAMHLTNA